MSVLKGDYIGFSFGKKADGTPMHSSDLGIVRTSDGSRFNENLLPTMQDKTVQVPGGDGTYYFGSYYTQRQFTVNFAFDSLTEEQFAQLQTHFGDKGVYDLIFDERPYKVYSAKVTGTATLKYLVFDEGTTDRVYKGEGSVQFTCYNPFARSKYKWLSQYSQVEYPNIDEWEEASRLQFSPWIEGDMYDSYFYQDFEDKSKGQRILLYNAGDKETDFQLTLTAPEIKTTITLEEGKGVSSSTPIGKLVLEPFTAAAGETLILNTKTNLIEGFADGKRTGNIYNQYIIDGDFFKIPIGDKNRESTLKCSSPIFKEIKYDYLYY